MSSIESWPHLYCESSLDLDVSAPELGLISILLSLIQSVTTACPFPLVFHYQTRLFLLQPSTHRVKEFQTRLEEGLTTVSKDVYPFLPPDYQPQSVREWLCGLKMDTLLPILDDMMTRVRSEDRQELEGTLVGWSQWPAFSKSGKRWLRVCRSLFF